MPARAYGMVEEDKVALTLSFGVSTRPSACAAQCFEAAGLFAVETRIIGIGTRERKDGSLSAVTMIPRIGRPRLAAGSATRMDRMLP